MRVGIVTTPQNDVDELCYESVWYVLSATGEGFGKRKMQEPRSCEDVTNPASVRWALDSVPAVDEIERESRHDIYEEEAF
eukprot:5182020-Pyramimonas_sp.AAC.1